MSREPILISGGWRESRGADDFIATNPATGKSFGVRFPVSSWEDCDAALAAAEEAFRGMREMPAEAFAAFLTAYAAEIERRTDAFVETAHQETALAKTPRLKDVELPRTTDQLRKAASAAVDPAWRLPVIDTEANLRSCLEPLGPCLVIGPNNFPFAYNGLAGGDFAAAIAGGNPVIGKAHPLHPNTTRLFAEAALAASEQTGMPSGAVQLLYHMAPENGLKMVADPRLAAAAFTGSRRTGLSLMEVADRHGKPIFLEMSSINPVVILPGALRENMEKVVKEFVSSCLLACGQFCTSPGFVILLEGDQTDAYLAEIQRRFVEAPTGALLSFDVRDNAVKGIQAWREAGAELLVGGSALQGPAAAVENTLLRVSGAKYLENADALQQECFGPASLQVIAKDVDEALAIIRTLDGQLTGGVYSATESFRRRGDDGDEDAYRLLAPELAQRVGRLLNDKMPPGVAVSPAQNHGGPFPATGHPHFTAVGFPASLRRFTKLTCYDHVRPERLPATLRDPLPCTE